RPCSPRRGRRRRSLAGPGETCLPARSGPGGRSRNTWPTRSLNAMPSRSQLLALPFAACCSAGQAWAQPPAALPAEAYEQSRGFSITRILPGQGSEQRAQAEQQIRLAGGEIEEEYDETGDAFSVVTWNASNDGLEHLSGIDD